MAASDTARTQPKAGHRLSVFTRTVIKRQRLRAKAKAWVKGTAAFLPTPNRRGRRNFVKASYIVVSFAAKLFQHVGMAKRWHPAEDHSCGSLCWHA